MKKIEVEAKYIAFVKENGELYENKMVSLTSDDIDDILRRKKRAKKVSLIILLMIMVFFTSGLILAEALDAKFYISMAALLVLVVGATILTLTQFNTALRLKSKRIIKGVVTNMILKKGCFIELSMQHKLQVLPADYKKIMLGDIIIIEALSDDTFMKRKVTKLGNL